MDFKDLKFILSDYGVAVLCLLEETSDSELVTSQVMTESTEPSSSSEVKWPQGSRPLVIHVGSVSSSPSTEEGWCKSDTNTDIEALMDYQICDPVLLRLPGRAKT